MYLFFLFFILNYKMLKLIKPNNLDIITHLHIYNAQSVSLCTLKNCPQMGVLNVQRCNKYPYIDIKYAAILNFVPMLRVHDIIVFNDNGSILTIDYTPINQSNPNVLMRLLIGKSVPAEIRLRKMSTWNLTEWYSLPNIDISDIDDIELRNKIIRIIDSWNQKHMDIIIDRGLKMNLYKRNCKHFSNFLIRNF